MFLEMFPWCWHSEHSDVSKLRKCLLFVQARPGPALQTELNSEKNKLTAGFTSYLTGSVFLQQRNILRLSSHF